MKTTIKAYFVLPSYKRYDHPDFLRQELALIRMYKSIFTPIIQKAFECESDEIEFIIPNVTAIPASEYKNSQMFKFGKRVMDYIGNADIVCLCPGWENSADGFADATAAVLYSKPVLAYLGDEEDNDVLIDYCNIPSDIKPYHHVDGTENDFYYFGDVRPDNDENVLKLYICEGFNMVDIVQHYYISGHLDPDIELHLKGGDEDVKTESEGT